MRLTLAIPPAVRQDRPPGRQPALVDLNQCRVLVVDDLATNRLAAVTHMRLMGTRPKVVNAGFPALDAVNLNPPDLVLLNMLMAGMDGVETCQRFRALPGAARRTPVTADASDDRRRARLVAGFNGCVTKAISPELLGAVLQAVITPQAVRKRHDRALVNRTQATPTATITPSLTGATPCSPFTITTPQPLPP